MYSLMHGDREETHGCGGETTYRACEHLSGRRNLEARLELLKFKLSHM